MKRWTMVVMLACLLAAPARALEMPPDEVIALLKEVPIETGLYRAEELARSRDWEISELRETLARRGLKTSEQGEVYVTIAGPEGGEAIPETLVEAFGGRGAASWRQARDAWVPVDQLLNLARALPEGYFLRRVYAPVPTASGGEGAIAVNSAGYRDGGAEGTGLTVAIMDGGWDLLTEAVLNGDAPSDYVAIDFTGGGPFESDGEHGTGCLEAVYDHAPGAAYRLYKIDSATHIGMTVEDAINNGVDIFSNSIAGIGLGWPDDSGYFCDAANLAGENGILFFTSAGNWAQEHYQGFYNPWVDDPRYHDFNGSGDIKLRGIIPDGWTTACTLLWNTEGGIFDYNIYLFDAVGGLLAHSDNFGNHFEGFEYTNDSGSAIEADVVVGRFEGGITEFEVFLLGFQMQEYIVSSSSTASPANSTHPLVITVGAVNWTDYGAGNGANVITNYSSWGPSNSGMSLPDICGPTLTTGTAFPGGMGGTSNSTPNAAGAACALWSADLLLHRHTISWLLSAQAALWKDWGVPGWDQVYGQGGLILYDYAPNTLWVSRVFGNTTNDRRYPLYTVAGAESWGIPGGRIVFIPGEHFPELVTLTKELRYETAEYPTVLGQSR